MFVDNRLLLMGLQPNMAYNVVVEARKMRKHDAISEGMNETRLFISRVDTSSYLFYSACFASRC